MASVLDTLIFDRTQEDVDRVRELKVKYLGGTITPSEQTEYIAGLKGAYNSTDMNRVGEAVQFVGDLLNTFGHTVSVYPKTNWLSSDIPTSAQATRYIQDLQSIQQADGTTVRTIQLPTSLDNLNYVSANNIERMLYEVGTVYNNSSQAFHHLSFTVGRPTLGTRG